MPGHWTAAELLSSIDQALSDLYCDSRKVIQIGDGSCNIQYTCHGDVPGQTTHGMAAMLKTVVASPRTAGLVSYTTARVRVCSDTNPEARPGTDPCVYTFENQVSTHVADRLQMDVVYVPTGNPAANSDQGSLSYQIVCPVVGKGDCGLCKGFQDRLKGAGGLASEELMGLFEGAGFLTEAVCALAGS